MLVKITAVLTIATTIIGLFISIKKGNKKEYLLKFARILQKLPEIISTTEKISPNEKSGPIKLLLALNQIRIECQDNNIKYVEEDWKTEIEKILSTPQKKENKQCEEELEKQETEKSSQEQQS